MVVLSFQVIPRLSPQQHRGLRLRAGDAIIRCGIAESSGEPAPLGLKTRYNDTIFEKAFITLFARKMEPFAEPLLLNSKQNNNKNKGFFDFWGYDYESFVDVSKRVMLRRSRLQQQQVVREVLLSMLPPGAPAQVDITLLFYFVFIFATFSVNCRITSSFISFNFETLIWEHAFPKLTVELSI